MRRGHALGRAAQCAAYETRLRRRIEVAIAPVLTATTIEAMRAQLVEAGLAIYRHARETEASAFSVKARQKRAAA